VFNDLTAFSGGLFVDINKGKSLLQKKPDIFD